MIHAYWLLVVFVLGFAGGWAFYKHRAQVKAKAVAESKRVADAIKADLKKL